MDYQSPSATLIGFVAQEKLAVIFDFDDLRDAANSQGGSAVLPSEGDIDVPNS